MPLQANDSQYHGFESVSIHEIQSQGGVSIYANGQHHGALISRLKLTAAVKHEVTRVCCPTNVVSTCLREVQVANLRFDKSCGMIRRAIYAPGVDLCRAYAGP